MTRHFRTLYDLGTEGLERVLDRAAIMKATRGQGDHPRPLVGKSVALIFEKASTRTRVSFEVGVAELGGTPVVLMGKDTQLGRGEPLADTARMLSSYVHAVVYRTFGHERIETLAAEATIPVINGLSDLYHPCQLLADLQTVRESLGPDLRGVCAAWIGDGNNMAHSWMVAAALAGMELTLACPEGFDPDPSIVAAIEGAGGQKVRVVRDPKEAVRGASVISTDVWASMGQEDEAARRREAFRGFCVDDDLLSLASANGIFLHCLPAHRGEEVTAEVLEGPRSRVWQQADNRLHAQKALLEWVFEGP
ncbi:MAG: ornithine carbamoyltransferase [Myxococcales bacterium]|nr:ornithine carbamoyltransferase [Myxococcales bacterium]